MSRHHAVVALDAHLAWLRVQPRRAPTATCSSGRSTGVDVGTVRWDAEGGGEWEVSITVAPRGPRPGHGGALLRAGEQWLAAHRDCARLPRRRAHGNEPSRRLFVSGGYAPDLPADDEGFERWVRTVR